MTQMIERSEELLGIKELWEKYEGEVKNLLNWIMAEADKFSTEMTTLGDKGIKDHIMSCKVRGREQMGEEKERGRRKRGGEGGRKENEEGKEGRMETMLHETFYSHTHTHTHTHRSYQALSARSNQPLQKSKTWQRSFVPRMEPRRTAPATWNPGKMTL